MKKNRIKGKWLGTSHSRFFISAMIIIALSFASVATFAATRASIYDNHKVATISPSGTSINLFDYWLQDQTSPDTAGYLKNNGYAGGGNGREFINYNIGGKRGNLNYEGINKSQALKFNLGNAQGVSANGWVGSNNLKQGIFKNTLVNGYPVLKGGVNDIRTDESLNYLFNNSYHPGKKGYSNVENLLQVDKDGYYYYDSSRNYAYFNSTTNSFDVYDAAAVRGGTTQGYTQFFPFNKPSDVFESRESNGELQPKNINSENDILNHWFGMTMTTRFVQPENGMVGRNHMTYEFSGDDDVLVFIDDVLVGDLGGIHNKADLKIDFNTGSVAVKCGTWNKNTTLRACFQNAGYTSTELNKIFGYRSNTFKKDTYHTLKFFYLERGNNESNMSLKFNLKAAPESSLIKVDENGKSLKGAEFNLYASDASGAQGKLISTGKTDANGSIVFVDQYGELVDFNYYAKKENITRYVLKETHVPPGYRSHEDFYFSYKEILDTGYGYIESDDIYGTGAFASPIEMIETSPTVEGVNGKVYTLEPGNNMCFAVILAKDINDPNKWYPITGNPIDGWKPGNALSLGGGINQSLIDIAKANNWVMLPSSSGSFTATVDNLPGKVGEYYFANKNNFKYTVAFYYTSANNWNEVTNRNTHLLNNDKFERTFGTNLYIPNVKNTFTVQKVDSEGNPITSDTATFELYAASDVTGNKINQGARPVETLTTSPDPANIATVKFGEKVALNAGTYYLKEAKAPKGYVANDKLVEVKITNKAVYANAGSVNDGIYVQRGVGKHLASVGQFGAKGNVNNSLTNITAKLRVSDTFDPNTNNWQYKNQAPIHLRYTDNPDSKFEYVLVGRNGATFIGTDTGWSDLHISQCKTHKEIPRDEIADNYDISACFTGNTHIRISNPQQIKLTKTVEGSQNWNNDSFGFTVKAADAHTSAAVIPAEWSNITLTESEKSKVLSLGDIKFDKVGTYKFTIKEKLPSVKGDYLYSDQAYTLTVDVKEAVDPNREGLLETTYSLTDKDGKAVAFDNTNGFYPLEFVNTYNPQVGPNGDGEISSGLQGTKNIVGRSFKEGDNFTFGVRAITPNAPMPKDAKGKDITSVTINPTSGESVNIDFGTIKFTYDDMKDAKLDANSGKYKKTFVYEIAERSGMASGMDYDLVPVTVKITVTDDGHGNLTASTPIYSSGNTLNWTNVYTSNSPKDVKTTNGTSVDGQMVQVGDILTYEVKWVNNEKDANGKFVNSEIKITDVIPTGTEYVENSVSNGGSFDSANNSLAWTINAKAHTSGQVSFKVKVAESAAGANVQNQASIKIGANNPKQTNTVTSYVPGKTAQVGGTDESVQVGKTLTYTIKYCNTEKAPSTVTIRDTIPEGTEYITDSATNGGVYKNGLLSKPTITWNIENVAPGATGTVSFKVKITENALKTNKIDNKATIQIGNNNPQVSTNTQSTPIDTNGTLTISKAVVSADGFTAPTDANFTFKLTINSNGGALTSETYKAQKFDPSGKPIGVAFNVKSIDNITLQAKESIKIYGIKSQSTYEVNEINLPAGFHQNKPVNNAAINGTITGGVNDIAEFTNTYKPTSVVFPSGDVKLGGTKNLVGRTFEKGDTFKFKITSADGLSPLPKGDGNVELRIDEGSALVGKNQAHFDFGKIEFEKAGTYSYNIVEIDPETITGQTGLPSMSYDKTVYKLDVVIDINKTGDGLEVKSVEISKRDGAKVDSPFEVIYKDSNGRYPSLEQFIFTNIYSKTTVNVTPQGLKVLENKKLSDYKESDMFAFRVEAAGVRNINTTDKFAADPNQPMPKASESGKYAGQHVYMNGTNGNIAIPDIAFTHDHKTNTGHAGKEYKYNITEIQPTVDGTFGGNPLEGATKNAEGKWVYKGITFDNSTKTIVVKVSAKKNADGAYELLTNVTSPDTTSGQGAIVFNNKYNAVPVAEADLTLKGTKKLVGREFKAGDKYTFEITAKNGAPLPKKDGKDVTSVTINPNLGQTSEIDFGSFKFTSKDLNEVAPDAKGTRSKDFVYSIKEKAENLEGITYDTADRTVKVTVTDDGLGNMTVAKVYSVDGNAVNSLSWTNVYTSQNPKTVTTGNKQVTGDIKVGDELTYNIKWTNNAQDNKGNFVPANVTVKDVIPQGTEYIANSAGNGTYDQNTKTITWSIPANAREIGTVSFKVKVTEDAVKGNSVANTASIKIGENGPEIATNPVTTPLAPKVGFAIEKEVQVKDLQGTVIDEAKKFEFTVQLTDANGNALTGSYPYTIGAANGNISNGGKISLSHGQRAIITELPAGAKYTVTETTLPGYKVTVDGIPTDTAKGSAISNPTEAGKIVKFINSYSATPGTFTPSVEAGGMFIKTLIGRDWNDTDKFTFSIEADTSTPNAPLPAAKTVEVTKANKNGFNFGAMTFAKAGTYKYVVKEVIPPNADKISGIEYDEKNVAKLTITVTDNKDGKLVVKPSDVKVLNETFTNSYKASTEIALEGVKNINGREFKAGDEFTFDLKPVTEGAPLPMDTAGKNITSVTIKPELGNKKDFSFGSIIFTQADLKGVAPDEKGVRTKDFVYEIKEVDGEIVDVQYDTAVKTVTVTVTDDGNGNMTATSNAADSLVWNNQYIKLKDVKDNNGTIADQTIQVGDVLTYEINWVNKAKDNTGKPISSNVIIKDKLPAGTKFVEASNNVRPDSGDVLTWNIKANAAQSGTVTFKVKVTEDAKTSIDNTAKIQIGENGPIITTNPVKNPIAQPVNLSIKKTVKVTAEEGTEIDANKAFTFTVKLTDKANVPLEGEFSYKIGQTQGSIRNGGTIKLKHGQVATIEGLPAGTKYTVVETALPGYTADKAEKTGTANNNTVDFINTYKTTPGTFTPSAETGGMFTKTLTGRDWKDSDKFVFEIEADKSTPNAPLPADKNGNPVKEITVEKPASGNTATFGFGAIKFNKVGTYKYNIKEVQGNDPTITYSDNIATLEISVIDGKDGKLLATVVKRENKAFVNKYNSTIEYEKLGARLEIYKVLYDRDMQKDQFSFELKPLDKDSAAKLAINEKGESLKSVPAAMDSESLIKVFDKLKFTEADTDKTYGFTVKEINDSKSGYSYDNAEYKVEIKVNDLGDGKITAVTTVTKDKKGISKREWTTGDTNVEPIKLVFENTYTADSSKAQVNIEATKSLTGRNMKAGEFAFNVNYANGDKGLVTTGTNDAEGKITFKDSLVYTISDLNKMVRDGRATKDGNKFTIYYTASEDTSKLAEAGITATNATFGFTVEAVDNGDGTITAVAKYPKGGMKFVNTYGAKSDNIPLEISGIKNLSASEGLVPPSIAGKYEFTMTAKDGGPLPKEKTVLNDESGNIAFGSMVFTFDMLKDVKATENGVRTKTFHYSVEEKGQMPGISNDTSKEFQVTLTDNGKGVLTATPSKQVGDIVFAFTNTYKVAPKDSSITDTIKFKKTLTGRALEAGEFTFELVNVDTDKVVSTVTNNESGDIVFDPITYDKPGVFYYAVREVEGDKGGVTYDKKVYDITTTVVDNHDGTLSVDHKLKGNEKEFKNSYKAKDAIVEIGAMKELIGSELKDGQFMFELKDNDGKVVSTAKNDENGQIIFDALTYDKEGTYKYTISEVNGSDKNIKYDNTVFDLIVTVKDDKKGQLTAEVTTKGDDGILFVNEYEEPEIQGGNDKPNDPDVPKTSDEMPIGRLFVIMFTSLGIALAVRRKNTI